MSTKNSQKPDGSSAATTARAVLANLAGHLEWMWTWSGVSFGYREGDSLYTHDGVEVGRFRGREVFGPDGRYLGETGTGRESARLITNTHKRFMTNKPFIPTLSAARGRQPEKAGLPLYSGHTDFPDPSKLKTAAA
jgi:hypothetical protein